MTSGIVRRIDELGRIVIPKEIRKSLRIKDGDNLEIVVSEDEIVLRKYSQIENMMDMVSLYAESFYQVLRYNVIVTDCDKILAVAGNLKKKYLGKDVSSEIENYMIRRNVFVERKKQSLEISPGLNELCYYTFSSIIKNGDVIGSVIILSTESPMLEQEEKLSQILADMLSNYFE